ncbi:MAG: saccharopine dehydrogenase NADP-binding domain-containing protein, partial [Rhizobiales bacterium]|nr:saccharopine dehydrogenase NADP-binding domain-containing protein [Hyphomicrobiales bacterium]
MKTITVVGAGKIGSTIAAMLAETSDYRVELVDRSEASLDGLPARLGVTHHVVDVTARGALANMLTGSFAVISALPFHLTTAVASAAIDAGVHYLDLTEDVASTRFVKSMAANAKAALIPQCGLAPGFISIVASDIASRFDSLDSIRMRVGALPQFPSNGLNYSLTWSTDGVINEYCEPCEAIANGRLVSVPPLEEREEFSLDGVLYEAFNTSGGLGTLCETLAGKVRRLNYKTVRYPGHAAIMKVLLDDLRLGARRELLKDILEQALPTTRQDVVVVFVTVSGMKGGRLVEEIYAKKIYSHAEC